MPQNKDIYQILNDIYKAYVDKDCERLSKLLQEAESIDSSNVYLVKYKKLYTQICGDKLETQNKKVSGRVIKYMGKTIKCPHCGAPLVEDEYNKKVIQDYKSGKISKLKFKCPYCGTEFVWDYKGIKPLFLKDIRVGGEYEINGRKYKVAGVVQYSGVWQEEGDTGELVYNEYILYDKNGDILRLAESESKWWNGTNYEIEREVELSRKVDFPDKVEEITENYIKIDGRTNYFNEKDKVTVKKVYGEVGKGYEVGEKVLLYEFSYGGKSYVLEKEESKSNKEANIYEVVYKNNIDVNNSQVKNDNLFNLNSGSFNKFILNNDFIQFIVFLSIAAFLIFSPEIFFIVLIIFAFFDSVFESKRFPIDTLKFLLIFNGVLIFSGYLGYYIFHKKFIPEQDIITVRKDKNLEILNQINLDKINTISTGIYELYFNSNKPYTYKHTYTYDAGGKEYQYTYYNGFYFKIEDDKDKKALKNFFENYISKKDIILPLDENGTIKVDLKDYKGDLVLRKVEYKNLLGF